MPHKSLTPAKARMILSDKRVRSRKLTKRQRGFFGAVASMRMKA